MPGDEQFWLQNPVGRSFYPTDHFGTPRPYSNGLHEGLDLAAIDGSGNPVAVLAAQRGVVDKVAIIETGYGHYIRVVHDWPDGNKYVTWYGHMSDFQVKTGDFVQIGQKLGIAGSTGNSTGIHLHLTLQWIGHGLHGYCVDDVVDPEPFFRAGPVQPKKEAMYISDETIPDGTIMQPGVAFTKTWQIVNSGTTTWGAGYQLAFFDQEKMGGPDAVPLPAAAPGAKVFVSVDLVAPGGSGRHVGTWKARDPEGNFFEFPVTVDISIGGTTQTDDARYVADVTIPDGTIFQAGQTFLKKWKIRNTGTTTWGTGYQLAYQADDQMSAPASVPAPRTAAGEEAEVAVTLTAPANPGDYRSTWIMRNAQGQNFGEILFTLIKVEGGSPGVFDQMTYVNDVTFAEGTLVKAGQAMEKIWRVRNSGESTWGAGYELVFVSGEPMGTPDQVALPAIGPSQTAEITLNLIAPTTPGVFTGTWKARDAQGAFYDFELQNQIDVAATGDEVNDCRFVSDLTILDGSSKTAGESFLKTWRVRNAGTTKWGPGYVLGFFKDTGMGIINEVVVSQTEPGGITDISVTMKAPLAPGTYKSTWKMRSPQDEFFGEELYTIIKVPSVQPATMDNRAMFIAHETVPLFAPMKPGETFDKIWKVRNMGISTWGAGYSLAYLDGQQMDGPESVAFPVTETLEIARLKVTLKAPTTPGTYKGYWKLRDPRGKLFGPRLPVWIIVKNS